MKIFSQSVSVVLAMLLAVGQLPAEAGDLEIRVLDSDGSTAAAGSSMVKGFTVQVLDGAGNGVSDAAVVLRLPDAAVTGAFADGTHAAVAYTDEGGRAHLAGVQWDALSGVVGIRITATKGTSHAGMLFEESLIAGIAPVTAEAPQAPHAAEAVQAAPATAPAAPDPVAVLPKPGVPLRQPGTVDALDRLPNLRPVNSVNAASVSVTNGPTGAKIHGGGGKKKWIILAVAVAAGAGAAVAMAAKGKSGSSSSTTSGISIGTPTVSIGAP